MAIKKSVQKSTSSNTSLFSIIGYKYLPYWPLFLLLGGMLLGIAWVYTRYITPMYRISATLLVMDEQRGVQESETLRSLNAYTVNTTVENEIQVLTSRTLLKDIVTGLHLYAPVFEEGRVKAEPAYLTSPIVVQAREPDKIREEQKVFFTYEERTQRVRVGNKYYPLRQWLLFPFGVIRFEPNPNRTSFSPRAFYFSLVNPRAVAQGIGSRLEVGATSKLSSFVTIQYTDEVPRRGEDIVNRLLEAYNRTSLERSTQLAANTLTFVTERIRDVEQELDSIERNIQQFKTEQGIVDLSQQGRLYLESVAENDRRAAEVNAQLAVLEHVERYVRSGSSRSGIVPTTLGINDPVLVDLLQKLNTLELQYANLNTRVDENNPYAKSVENEIRRIRPNILGIVRNQRARLQASLANYNRSSGQVNARLRAIPQKERQLLEISRQQDIKNEVYSFLLQRREEAELNNVSNIAQSRIIDRAESGVDPVGGKRMIILAAALVAALVLAVAYVFLREGISSKVLFRSALARQTTIPVVAEIAYRRHRKSSLAGIAADPVISAHFQQLQAALELYEPEAGRQCILVTSSIGNEGKTFVSNQLAISLAAAGKRVALVDLNLHLPETSRLHQLAEEKGLGGFVSGLDPAAVTRPSAFPNLDIVPAGAPTEQTTALLLNERMEALFAWLRQHYSYIIIDAPPVEITTDAFILSRFADRTVFLVRHGHTPNTIVQKLDENNRLQALKGLAIVFNGVKSRGFLRKTYGYGYGYGYEHVFKRKTYVAAQ